MKDEHKGSRTAVQLKTSFVLTSLYFKGWKDMINLTYLILHKQPYGNVCITQLKVHNFVGRKFSNKLFH